MSNLSQSTRLTRDARMRAMARIADCKIDKIFNNSSVLLSRLKNSSTYSNVYAANLLSTLLCLWPQKKMPKKKLQIQAFYSVLAKNNAKIANSGKIRGNLKKCTITVRKIKNAFKRALENDERFKTKRSTSKLLTLAIYALFAPKRSDWGDIILSSKNLENCNYINLKTNQLILCRYKTFIKYGIYREDLPAPFRNILDKSLVAWPRSTLFPKPMRPKSFGDLVRQTFKTYLKCELGINDIRHLIISEFGAKRRCFAERKKLAQAMHHSVSVQIRYEQFI